MKHIKVKHIEAIQKEIDFLKKIDIGLLQFKKVNKFYEDLTGFTILGLLRKHSCYLCKTASANCKDCIFPIVTAKKCHEQDFWNKLQDLTIKNNTEMLKAIKEYYKALEEVYTKYKASSKDE